MRPNVFFVARFQEQGETFLTDNIDEFLLKQSFKREKKINWFGHHLM